MIFFGKGRIKLDGQKHLTDQMVPQHLNNFKHVYLPLLNMGCSNYDVLVSEGDYVKVGQLVAFRNDNFYVPVFASVSGTVVGIEKMMSASLIYAQHIVIENDFKDEAIDNILNYHPDQTAAEDIVSGLKQTGISGCGGSGFPTYIKYSSNATIHTILINGVECEPFITIDYQLMKENVKDLILGVQFLMKAANAKEGIIAFKKNKSDLVKLIYNELDGITNISVKEVADAYPMGWERTLIKEVFNKTYLKLPSEIGVIVNNSTTAINVAQALTKGLDHTTGVTFSGTALKAPTNVIVPVGVKVADVVAQIGGYHADVDATNTKLVMGGPMMGKAVVTDEVALTSYSNAVSVLYEEVLIDVPCMRCARCVEYCPSGLQPVAIKDAELAKNLDVLKKLRAETCVACGLCSYICPSRIEVTDYTVKGKKRVDNA